MGGTQSNGGPPDSGGYFVSMHFSLRTDHWSVRSKTGEINQNLIDGSGLF